MDANLSRYMAVFSDYQVDHGNVFEPRPDFGRSNIFSSDYPPYPGAQKLCKNPNLPVKDKEYSSDNNSTTEDSAAFSLDDEDETEEGLDSDSEQSYVYGGPPPLAPHAAPF